MSIDYFAISFGSFLVAIAILQVLLKGGVLEHVVDAPNARSLHTVPVPRTGGLGLLAGVLVSWVWISPVWLWSVASCLIFLTIVSLVDDIRGLSAGWRLLMHLLGIGVFFFMMPSHAEGWLIVPLTVLTVWMANLFNFMDGSDGLAGGMAFFGFVFYAIAAGFATDMDLAMVSLAISAASVAFLCFNFNPAKIFMGDSGSIPLGFLAASLGYVGWLHGDWPFWFPVFVFSPFIMDASITLVKRIIRRERVWQAHRSHYYQRLVMMGFGHKKTAILEYALMLGVGTSAIVMLGLDVAWQAIGAICWLAVYAVLMLLIDRAWKAHEAT